MAVPPFALLTPCSRALIAMRPPKCYRGRWALRYTLMSEKLRMVFTSDVHASDRVYKKFMKAAEFYNAQILVLGGDVTGKAIIPI